MILLNISPIEGFVQLAFLTVLVIDFKIDQATAIFKSTQRYFNFYGINMKVKLICNNVV
jgi:hypothetical protein